MHKLSRDQLKSVVSDMESIWAVTTHIHKMETYVMENMLLNVALFTQESPNTNQRGGKRCLVDVLLLVFSYF